MPGKPYIKTGNSTWTKVKRIYIKSGGQTWAPIRKAYIKVRESGSVSGRWAKFFDTTSNRPFIEGNDRPKIRLNTFRTNSTYNPTGTENDPVNPVVEAPPVQQMGPPTTTPTSGWPSGTIGNHLWGYDGDWRSGNGSAITYTYQWLYNLTGDRNDNTFDPAFSPAYSSTTNASNTSSTGRADMLTNNSTYLGRGNGDYFDKNFLTFRVVATNSAGSVAEESDTQLYIVRQRPYGYVTMIDPNTIALGDTLSASITFEDYWYNKPDRSISYVDWHAVDNLGETLTSANRVSRATLDTFSTSGTTAARTATTFYANAQAGKYYYAQITLNNSNTTSAVIPISGFIPNAPYTAYANKTVRVSNVGAPTNIVVKSFIDRQMMIFFTTGSNTQSIEGYAEYDSFSTFDYIDGYVNTSSNSAGKLTLTGANSSTNFYYHRLRPYSGLNKTGEMGNLTPQSTSKRLNGSDNMTISLGSATLSGDRTISASWTLSTGAPTHYITRLYQYNNGALISTKTVDSTITNISFNSSDGTQYGLDYYIYVQPQYQYTSSVTYENNAYVTNNVNSGANLTAPTSTSIVSMSRLNDNTVRAVISSSGGSGPYYQLWWQSGSTAPNPETRYDAAGTTSTVTEDSSFANGITYYFYMRSSSENLGNTITNGNGTAGTYSAYGPTTGAASYTFAQPSGTVSVSPSSGTAGTTQFTATPSVSASPSAQISYQWQYFEGGAFGWVAIGGATSSTYTPPSNYVSLYGSNLRCQITANNGVGTQLVTNSSSVAVAAPGVAPSGGGVTLSPSGTQQAGTTLTANVSAMSGTATISYQTYIVKKTGSSPTSDTDGTRVASGTGTGNVATHTITASEASGTPDQFRAFTTGTNSFGSNSVASNTVISTPAVVTQYTINWNANGGSVTPTFNTVNSGTSVSAPTPTLSGYTFLYWRDSPNAFSYVYQINPGGSWTVNSNITFYAYWQQNAVAAPTITSGPGISWGSGNNFTLSATASNATNLEFQVQFANTSGGTVQNTQTYFFGASTGGGTTGAQSYPWARTRVRANNTSTGQSSAFTAYSGWA